MYASMLICTWPNLTAKAFYECELPEDIGFEPAISPITDTCLRSAPSRNARFYSFFVDKTDLMISAFVPYINFLLCYTGRLLVTSRKLYL
jgi:hypothetical protein